MNNVVMEKEKDLEIKVYSIIYEETSNPNVRLKGLDRFIWLSQIVHSTISSYKQLIKNINGIENNEKVYIKDNSSYSLK